MNFTGVTPEEKKRKQDAEVHKASVGLPEKGDKVTTDCLACKKPMSQDEDIACKECLALPTTSNGRVSDRDKSSGKYTPAQINKAERLAK